MHWTIFLKDLRGRPLIGLGLFKFLNVSPTSPALRILGSVEGLERSRTYEPRPRLEIFKMDHPVVHALGGVAVALGFIKGVRDATKTPSRFTDMLFLQSAHTANHRFALHWADALWIAAGIYVAMALTRQEKWSVVFKQMTGVAIYGVPAVLGRMNAKPGVAFWAGLGWLAHPIWDMMHHDDSESASYVPHFYPVLCLTFDLVMGAYLMNIWRKGVA